LPSDEQIAQKTGSYLLICLKNRQFCLSATDSIAENCDSPNGTFLDS
jgi:hypothetical protein